LTRRAWWPSPSLSLASGAIKGWDRRNGYYFAMLESLAKHYRFDIDAPFDSLPPEVQHAILQGSGEEDIKFSYVMDSGASQGKKLTKKHPFEGILPNMARRYRETDSVWCAKTWPATAAPSPARPATARACVAKPAM
jgi:excinuclease ABC subunit A